MKVLSYSMPLSYFYQFYLLVTGSFPINEESCLVSECFLVIFLAFT